MKYERTIRLSLISALGLTFGGVVVAQTPEKAPKPMAVSKKSGRDPFKKYEPPVKLLKSTTALTAPAVQARIERYRAQKAAAAAAHVAPPKPTTAFLLNEVQVTGIFRTPRGWAAMVEATPIKLSYVVYPGESFFDGQLVAIEENRLIFRRDLVMTDGRRDKTVEIKPLRKPTPVEDMAAKAPTTTPPEATKPGTPEK
jgi:Tfp pilus assembly protein PilP